MIKIDNLSKHYGSNYALDGLSLDLDSGTVVGLLGPNGSGKTTLIKIMAGLITKYSGDITIDGMIPGIKTKALISYLPDKFTLDQFKYIKDAGKYYEDFYPDYNKDKMDELLDNLNLYNNMKIKSLSKGMEEKLQLALTLSRDAKYYLLDEPIAGVDLISRDEILNTIIGSINPDSTIIVSTHLVADMESIIDTVAYIDNGKIIEHTDADTIREQYGTSIVGRYRQIFGGVIND